MINRLFFYSSGIAERTMSYIAYPCMKFQSCCLYPLQKISDYCTTTENFSKKIQKLTDENSLLQEQLTYALATEIFEQQSKEARSFAARYKNNQAKLAHILLRQVNEKEDIIYIDFGSDKGAKKDQIVVYKNVLIGRIIEVFPWYSKVALVTDQRCKIAAQSKKGVEGICCGKNNGRLEFQFVPHFKDVQKDEIMISTGKGLVYPKGFALGSISTIRSDHVSHYITATAIFSIDDVAYVYVLQTL